MFSALNYISDRTARNRLARQHRFSVISVSGLQGFADALSAALTTPNIIAVDDTSDGRISTDTTPKRIEVKTIYFAMRTAAEGSSHRTQALQIIDTLINQFASDIIRQKTQLELGIVGVGLEFAYNHIDKYFSAGYTCAYLQISATHPISLVFNPQDWIPQDQTPTQNQTQQ